MQIDCYGFEATSQFFRRKELDAHLVKRIDGVLYDATCPSCGEVITFDEDTLDEGSMKCPHCGELLEFVLEDDEDEDTSI